MRKVLAIAGIAVRNAIRSRVVVVLATLLLVAIVALPLTIKGDGTLTGAVQVLLRYTLGAVTIILSIATLWAGCAAIASEVADHQVDLIVTKPVRRSQLWLGKWLGLLALNAVLLAVAGGVTYALLRWNLQPDRLAARHVSERPEDILLARRIIDPLPLNIEGVVHKTYEEEQRRGEVPPNVRPDEILQAIRQTIMQQARSVPSGMAIRYVFKLPRPPRAGRPLIIRYKFSSSLTSKDPIAAIWTFGEASRADRLQLAELTVPDGVHELPVPPTMVSTNGILTVEVGNANQMAMTVVFAPEGGVQLLVEEGSFEANLVRSLLIILGKLAFLGALAVTLGSIFSLPVAALTAVYAVLLMNIGSYLQSLVQEPFVPDPMTPNAGPGVIDIALHALYVSLYWLTKPFQSSSPLEPLALGELVSWWWVASVVWWQVIVAAGLLAALGIYFFNRRELGLPA